MTTPTYPPRVWLRQSTAPRLRYAELPEQIEYISLPEVRSLLEKVSDKIRTLRELASCGEWSVPLCKEALADINKFLEGKCEKSMIK